MSEQARKLIAPSSAPAPAGAPLVLPDAPALPPGFVPLASGLVVRVSPLVDLSGEPLSRCEACGSRVALGFVRCGDCAAPAAERAGLSELARDVSDMLAEDAPALVVPRFYVPSAEEIASVLRGDA